MAWHDEYGERCPDCRATYQQREPPQQPPCWRCKIDLIEENEDAAKVYLLTRKQVITVGMGQVIDISIPAVKCVMDLYGVRDQESCLMKVRKLFFKSLETKDDASGSLAP